MTCSVLVVEIGDILICFSVGLKQPQKADKNSDKGRLKTTQEG
jgi:hypothetical protein